MSFMKMVLIGILFSGFLFATTAQNVVPDLSGYTTKTEQIFGSEQKLYGAKDGITKCNLTSGYMFEKVNLGEDIEIAGVVFQCNGNNQNEISIDIIDSLKNHTYTTKKSMNMKGITVHYFEESIGFQDSYAIYYYYNYGEMHVELACVDSKDTTGTNCNKVLEQFITKIRENDAGVSCCFPMIIFGIILLLVFKTKK